MPWTTTQRNQPLVVVTVPCVPTLVLTIPVLLLLLLLLLLIIIKDDDGIFNHVTATSSFVTAAFVVPQSPSSSFAGVSVPLRTHGQKHNNNHIRIDGIGRNHGNHHRHVGFHQFQPSSRLTYVERQNQQKQRWKQNHAQSPLLSLLSPCRMMPTLLSVTKIVPRGGEGGTILSATSSSSLGSAATSLTETPSAVFDTLLVILSMTAILWKFVISSGRGGDGNDLNNNSSSSNSKGVVNVLQRSRLMSRRKAKHNTDSTASKVAVDDDDDDDITSSTNIVRPLQIRYWIVFWIMRCSYWMSGPYIVPTYRHKLSSVTPSLHPTQLQQQVSSIFVCGYVAQAFALPMLGQWTDKYGRRKAVVLYAILLGLGFTSLRFPISQSHVDGGPTSKLLLLIILMIGRAFMGCAIGLLQTAPESWLNTEVQRRLSERGEEPQPQSSSPSESRLSSSRDDTTQSRRVVEDPKSIIGKTIGMAFTGDAIVAILAGKLASWAATAKKEWSPSSLLSSLLLLFLQWKRTTASSTTTTKISSMTTTTTNLNAPFDLASIILVIGIIATMLLWNENVAADSTRGNQAAMLSSNHQEDSSPSSKFSSMKESLRLFLSDPKLRLACAVQSLFESTMNMFVLHWTSIIGRSVRCVYGNDAVTPFGTIFSCFMTCSLLGSISFGKMIMKSSSSTSSSVTSSTNDERSQNQQQPQQQQQMMAVGTAASMMLAVATACLATTTWLVSSTTTIGNSSSSPLLISLSPAVWNLVGTTSMLCLFEGCVGWYFPTIGTIRSLLIPDTNKSVIAGYFAVTTNILVIALYLTSGFLGVSGSFGICSVLLSMATVCMTKLQTIIRKEWNEDHHTQEPLVSPEG